MSSAEQAGPSEVPLSRREVFVEFITVDGPLCFNLATVQRSTALTLEYERANAHSEAPHLNMPRECAMFIYRTLLDMNTIEDIPSEYIEMVNVYCDKKIPESSRLDYITQLKTCMKKLKPKWHNGKKKVQKKLNALDRFKAFLESLTDEESPFDKIFSVNDFLRATTDELMSHTNISTATLKKWVEQLQLFLKA
jgi:hypothetical protein